MNMRSIWAKKQLKRLFALEGDVLDILIIHEAAIELSLESPLEEFRKKRFKIVEAEITRINKKKPQLPNPPKKPKSSKVKISKFTQKKARLPYLPTENKSTQGYVYVITTEKGKYKIGRTRDIKHRIQALQTFSHKKIRLVLKVKTTNCNVLEILCHRKFSDKRIFGEWFALTDEDLQWIRNLPKM